MIPINKHFRRLAFGLAGFTISLAIAAAIIMVAIEFTKIIVSIFITAFLLVMIYLFGGAIDEAIQLRRLENGDTDE